MMFNNEEMLNEIYYSLKTALLDENEILFNETLEKRKKIIENIKDDEEKRKTVVWFLERDKILNNLLMEKSELAKELLISQNNNKKAIKKYESF